MNPIEFIKIVKKTRPGMFYDVGEYFASLPEIEHQFCDCFKYGVEDQEINDSEIVSIMSELRLDEGLNVAASLVEYLDYNVRNDQVHTFVKQFEQNMERCNEYIAIHIINTEHAVKSSSFSRLVEVLGSVDRMFYSKVRKRLNIRAKTA